MTQASDGIVEGLIPGHIEPKLKSRQYEATSSEVVTHGGGSRGTMPLYQSRVVRCGLYVDRGMTKRASSPAFSEGAVDMAARKHFGFLRTAGNHH